MVSVELRIGSGTGTRSPEQELQAVELLLRQVFYIDTEPSQPDLEAFILAHDNYPVEALRDITGLTAEQIGELRKAHRPLSEKQ